MLSNDTQRNHYRKTSSKLSYRTFFEENLDNLYIQIYGFVKTWEEKKS